MDLLVSKTEDLPFWKQNILLFPKIKVTIHNENLIKLDYTLSCFLKVNILNKKKMSSLSHLGLLDFILLQYNANPRALCGHWNVCLTQVAPTSCAFGIVSH